MGCDPLNDVVFESVSVALDGAPVRVREGEGVVNLPPGGRLDSLGHRPPVRISGRILPVAVRRVPLRSGGQRRPGGHGVRSGQSFAGGLDRGALEQPRSGPGRLVRSRLRPLQSGAVSAAAPVRARPPRTPSGRAQQSHRISPRPVRQRVSSGGGGRSPRRGRASPPDDGWERDRDHPAGREPD